MTSFERRIAVDCQSISETCCGSCFSVGRKNEIIVVADSFSGDAKHDADAVIAGKINSFSECDG